MKRSTYSNGEVVATFDNEFCGDLEYPTYYLGIENPRVWIISPDPVTADDPRRVDASSIADGLREVIGQQPDFSGDADEMSARDLERYATKHLHIVAFSRYEHGLVAYKVSSSYGWDEAPAGSIVTRSDVEYALAADQVEDQARSYCDALTAYANNDEYRVTYYDQDGQPDAVYGYYGYDEARAELETWDYIGEHDPADLEDPDYIHELLIKHYPDRYRMESRRELVPSVYVPSRYIPAHVEESQVFARIA